MLEIGCDKLAIDVGTSLDIRELMRVRGSKEMMSSICIAITMVLGVWRRWLCLW
jgi:hypothetical protein